MKRCQDFISMKCFSVFLTTSEAARAWGGLYCDVWPTELVLTPEHLHLVFVTLSTFDPLSFGFKLYFREFSLVHLLSCCHHRPGLSRPGLRWPILDIDWFVDGWVSDIVSGVLSIWLLYHLPFWIRKKVTSEERKWTNRLTLQNIRPQLPSVGLKVQTMSRLTLWLWSGWQAPVRPIVLVWTEESESLNQTGKVWKPLWTRMN